MEVIALIAVAYLLMAVVTLIALCALGLVWGDLSINELAPLLAPAAVLWPIALTAMLLAAVSQTVAAILEKREATP